MTPGQEIRKIRQEKNLTLKEFSKLLGISYGHLSRLECDKYRVTGDLAVHIESTVGISRALLRPDLFVISR